MNTFQTVRLPLTLHHLQSIIDSRGTPQQINITFPINSNQYRNLVIIYIEMVVNSYYIYIFFKCKNL